MTLHKLINLSKPQYINLKNEENIHLLPELLGRLNEVIFSDILCVCMCVYKESEPKKKTKKIEQKRSTEIIPYS